jgi:hypothetical protein
MWVKRGCAARVSSGSGLARKVKRAPAQEAEMKSLQRLVIAVLLGIWCFPAVSFAAPLPTPGGAAVGSRAASGASPAPTSTETEASALGAREQASQDLQNFKGGAAYIYIGGGATFILLLILLILIV